MKSLFAVAVFILSFAYTALADKVQVILHMPPPTQLRVEQLWSISLINTTSAPLRIKLFGIARDGTGRWIADGTSSSFNVPPGAMNVGPSDIGPIDYHADPDYNDVVARTGTVPAGTYTICIYAIGVPANDTIGHDCSSAHVVLNVTPPQLITPRNKEFLRDVPPVFVWTPISPTVSLIGVTYRLNIVELIGRQTPYDAMQSNPSWFSEDNLSTTVLQYPISAEKLEPGASYAWQVTAIASDRKGAEGTLAKSEIRSFTMAVQDTLVLPVNNTVPDDPCRALKAKLTGTGKERTYKLTISNNDTAGIVHPGHPTPIPPYGIIIKCHKDSFSIVSGVSKGWERKQSSSPQGGNTVTWTSTAGPIPPGATELGVLTFGGVASTPTTVIVEWLNKSAEVICKDSLTLNARLSYYELTDEESSTVIEVPNDVLHIEFVNPYASTSDGSVIIVDRQTNVPVKSRMAKPAPILTMNGLNRIAVPLAEYSLSAGKPYQLRVAGAKSTYFLTFKIKSDKATNDREK